jgi:SAM-dependent methyltransferase
VRYGKRIMRAVTAELVPDVERLIVAGWFRERVAAGSLPETHWVTDPPPGYADRGEFRWLEHAAIRFPCYPHEITGSQLHQAGELTLSLARDALRDGWILKDASAWNVLFDRGRPVFCDILSFAPAGASGLWQAYAQFQRHFVIPLMLQQRAGLRTSRLFLSRRDGVEPEDARRMLTGFYAWRQPALEAVTLPALLENRGGRPRAAATQKNNRQSDPRLNRYLLERTYNRLRSHLDRVRPRAPGRPSRWANYEAERDHYSEGALVQKRAFVSDALTDPAIQTVLDLGCNTGEFSLLADSLGKEVVAADYDEQSLERLVQRLREGDSRIQPVLLDLGRPTPAVGWLNSEIPAFLTRAAGQFDCIMMLGLIHHLLVSERATLEGLVQLLESLGGRTVIIEWVGTTDRRFQQIAGINAQLYENLTREQFEAALCRRFTIEKREALPGDTRTLYECRRNRDQ